MSCTHSLGPQACCSRVLLVIQRVGLSHDPQHVREQIASTVSARLDTHVLWCVMYLVCSLCQTRQQRAASGGEAQQPNMHAFICPASLSALAALNPTVLITTEWQGRCRRQPVRELPEKHVLAFYTNRHNSRTKRG